MVRSKSTKITLAASSKGSMDVVWKKVPVFGLLKRGGKVYTKVIPDASSATLYPIIARKVVPGSVVYLDCWRGL